jgi:FKBP-type peptidyl-prolyl cis-trans isomerase 2
LGFYKEKAGFEEIVALVKGDPLQLYIEIPSRIRNRMEIVVGNRIRCIVKDIIDKEGNSVAEVNQETLWEVMGYWHELYIPPEDASRYGVKKNDYARLVLRSVVRGSDEVEI